MEKKLSMENRPTFYQSGHEFILRSNHKEVLTAREVIAKIKVCNEQKKLMEDQLELFSQQIVELEKLKSSAEKVIKKEMQEAEEAREAAENQNV